MSSSTFSGETGKAIADLNIHFLPSSYLIVSLHTNTTTEPPMRLSPPPSQGATRDTITIVDAINYIKRFRYQMYCKVQEAGVRRNGCQALHEPHSSRILRPLNISTPHRCQKWSTDRADGEQHDHKRKLCNPFSILSLSLTYIVPKDDVDE